MAVSSSFFHFSSELFPRNLCLSKTLILLKTPKSATVIQNVFISLKYHSNCANEWIFRAFYIFTNVASTTLMVKKKIQRPKLVQEESNFKMFIYTLLKTIRGAHGFNKIRRTCTPVSNIK